jgi:ribonuclease HI
MEQTGESGVGVIARDGNGDVLFTAWKFFDKCASAPEVEALACTEGLRWAHHWGFTQIILESDCARITLAMMSNAPHRSEVGPIIEEARSWMCSMNRCSISQVKSVK